MPTPTKPLGANAQEPVVVADNQLTEPSLSIFKTPIKRLLLPFLSRNTADNQLAGHSPAPKTPNSSLSIDAHRSPMSAKSASGSAATPASILQSVKQSSLLLEYSSLRISAPPGCYVIPEAEEPHIWHGVLFVHRGPFQGLVFRFAVHWSSHRPLDDSLLAMNSSCSDVNDADAVTKCLAQLPVIKIISPTACFIHPLVKNFNQLDITLFIYQQLRRSTTDSRVFEAHRRPARISAAMVLEALALAFNPSGLECIANSVEDCQLAMYVPNLDATKILVHDRAAFNKLAQEAVKATLDENMLYAEIDKCPFRFKPAN